MKVPYFTDDNNGGINLWIGLGDLHRNCNDQNKCTFKGK